MAYNYSTCEEGDSLTFVDIKKDFLSLHCMNYTTWCKPSR